LIVHIIVFSVFVAYAPHRHWFAAVHGVTAARLDPVEMAEKEHGRTSGTRLRVHRTPILRDGHEETEPVHQLRHFVMTIVLYLLKTRCCPGFRLNTEFTQVLEGLMWKQRKLNFLFFHAIENFRQPLWLL